MLEHNSTHLRFEVAALKLGSMFRALEASRAALNIVDYSVSQTTLEAVFLSFSRMQDLADESFRALEAERIAARKAAGGRKC